jgi:acyl-CoA hydrolase
METKKVSYAGWQEDCKRKQVTAEETVRTVRSGDRVFITFARHPFRLTHELVTRKEVLGVLN